MWNYLLFMWKCFCMCCKYLWVVAFDSEVSLSLLTCVHMWVLHHWVSTWRPRQQHPIKPKPALSSTLIRQPHIKKRTERTCSVYQIRHTHTHTRFNSSLAQITCAWVCLMCFPSHGGAAKTITQDEGIFLWEASQCTRPCWHFTHWHQTGGSICSPGFRHSIIQEGVNKVKAFFFLCVLQQQCSEYPSEWKTNVETTLLLFSERFELPDCTMTPCMRH